MSIRDNIMQVQERLAEAALRSGRDPEAVTLVAVSKTVGVSQVKEAMDAGVSHFAENRVQMLLEKQKEERLAYPQTDWHLIGHLQTNKVKYVIDRVSLIHSVDSLHLAQEIDRQAEKHGRIMPVLLELNISGEESKFGLSPCEIDDFMEGFEKLQYVKCMGLMTMAPRSAETPEKRKIFRKLYNIYVDMGKQIIYNVDMSIMSMGMSNDFEVAVEEGSNMVRIGTSIFTQDKT